MLAGTTEDRVERTGVIERRYAPGANPTILAYQAVDDLLTHDPGAVEDIAATIVVSATADPAEILIGGRLHELLRTKGAAARDLHCVRNGFISALHVGQTALEDATPGSRVLIVAVDMLSPTVDRTDVEAVSVAGDGAAAVVLGTVPEPYGIRAIAPRFPSGAIGNSRFHCATETFVQEHHQLVGAQPVERASWELTALAAAIRGICNDQGVRLSDVDALVVDRPIVRELHDLAGMLQLPHEKFLSTAARFGSPGAAALPTVLAEAHSHGHLSAGHRLVLAALRDDGGVGAALLAWPADIVQPHPRNADLRVVTRNGASA